VGVCAKRFWNRLDQGRGPPLDNVLCVTPLACQSPSDSDSFGDCFDSQSSVDDDDLGSFTEMDESSDED
jgi:hypothetical protein